MRVPVANVDDEREKQKKQRNHHGRQDKDRAALIRPASPHDSFPSRRHQEPRRPERSPHTIPLTSHYIPLAAARRFATALTLALPLAGLELAQRAGVGYLASDTQTPTTSSHPLAYCAGWVTTIM